MKINNKTICELANQLISNPIETSLPVKYGFFIEKNKNKLFQLKKEIENFRFKILAKYGDYNKVEQTFNFNNINKEAANKELLDLLLLTQDVDISYIYLQDLINDNISFTQSQLQSIMFMIKETKEDSNE